MLFVGSARFAGLGSPSGPSPGTSRWPSRAFLVLVVAFGLACHGQPQHGHTACTFLSTSGPLPAVNESGESATTAKPRRRRAPSTSGGGTTDDEDWLTLVEAASLLGVSPRTLSRWADEGWLPVIRTPTGDRRFRRADIEGTGGRERPSDGGA